MERILSRIEADARGEIDGILADARKEAAQTEAAYRAEAENLRTQLAAKAERLAKARQERLVSAAQMEGRKTLLARRQKVVETAFQMAQERLSQLPRDEAVDVLAELLSRASTGGEEVLFSAADRPIGKAAVKKANAAGNTLTLSKESRDIRGGFILRKGDMEINCAFETLLRLERERSAAAVAKILFR